jgi:hypothetical protein
MGKYSARSAHIGSRVGRAVPRRRQAKADGGSILCVLFSRFSILLEEEALMPAASVVFPKRHRQTIIMVPLFESSIGEGFNHGLDRGFKLLADVGGASRGL